MASSRRIGLAAAGLVVAAGSLPVLAQPLQNGDIVIGAVYAGGRLWRLRDGQLSVLVDSGASGVSFGMPADLIIDSSGRVVFSSYDCGGNSNSAGIFRYDPATGVLSQLLCVPYVVGPGGPPLGLPADADSFYGISGPHLTRTLRVTIDDDVNGGVPEVGAAEAYQFAVGVDRPGLFRSEAFRMNPDTLTIEPGVSLLPLTSVGQGAVMCVGPLGTYYTNGSMVGLAAPDLSISLNAHTSVGGVDIAVHGALHVEPRNEIIFSNDILDNTARPNGTAMCNINGINVTDDQVPYDDAASFSALSIFNIGVLGGSLFATSNSVSTGVPWLFNLQRRDPFLNPYCCCYYSCVSHNGPYSFSQDPPALFHTTTKNGRVLGGDDGGGRVFSVGPDGYQQLASGLIRPNGVAAFPAETPSLTSAALVIRIDSPVNVLVTDAAGHRIGYDALGNQVNDFGNGGMIIGLGPEGHPRVYAVMSPAEGATASRLWGQGAGPTRSTGIGPIHRWAGRRR